MQNEEFSITTKWSKTRKYRLDFLQTINYQGKDYHSVIIYKAVRNYFEQVATGVNFTDEALEEYFNEDC